MNLTADEIISKCKELRFEIKEGVGSLHLPFRLGNGELTPARGCGVGALYVATKGRLPDNFEETKGLWNYIGIHCPFEAGVEFGFEEAQGHNRWPVFDAARLNYEAFVRGAVIGAALFHRREETWVK